MANKNKEILTTNQIVWLIAASVPVGLTTYPRDLNVYSQQSGWMMILLSAILFLLYSRFFLILSSRYPGQSIIAIVQLIMGKWLGLSFSFFLIILSILVSGLGIRILVDGVTTYILYYTPEFVTILSMAALVLYALSKGVHTFARLNEIVQPLSLLMIMLVFLLTANKTDFSNFIPLISKEFSPVRSFLTASTPFMSIAFIPFFFPYMPNRRKLWQGLAGGVGIICFTTLLLFIFSIALFGSVELDYIQYPSIDIARIIEFPLLERMEILFLFFWIPVAYTTHLYTAFISVEGVKELLKKEELPPLWLIFIIFLIILCAMIPADVEQTHQIAKILAAIMIGNLFLIFPLLVVWDSLIQRGKI